jgi:hypothetical protein
VGSDTVVYGVDANPLSSSRTGLVRIAGQNFAVTQSGSGTNGTGTNVPNCTFVLSSASATHSAASSTGIVSVTTQSGCGWEVFSSNSWIHAVPAVPSFHIGSDTVVYGVDANPGSTRTGFIRIAGQNFTVTQSGSSTNGTPGTNTFPGLTVGITDTGAMLSVHGSGNRTSVIECSEDLIHWRPISTNIAPCTVMDCTSMNAPRRFYRVLELP